MQRNVGILGKISWRPARGGLGVVMLAIVLGSGLGVLADEVEVTREVGFAEAGLAVSTVPGHAGKFLFGKLGGSDVVLMKGRVHL